MLVSKIKESNLGQVYAINIHELAIKSAFRMIEKHNLKNVKPILTDGHTATLIRNRNIGEFYYAILDN